MRSEGDSALPTRSFRRWLGRAWRLVAGGTRRADTVALAIVLVLVIADAGFFGAMGTLRFLTHSADAFDLGIEDQAMWSTLHGNIFGITLERRLTTSYLGYHVEPISLIGPLLYLIYNSPISLIVFKNVLLALGAIPAYWLARRHLGSAFAGVTFAAAYLLFPGLEAAGLYDFHAYSLTAPFLLSAFCFLEGRRYGWCLVFLALAGATKENAPLDAIPFGMYLVLTRRRLGLGFATAAIGLLWFGIATYVVVPAFNSQGQGWLWTRYGGMGGSPVGALDYFLTHPSQIWAPVPDDPNWQYVARLVAPVAGLALLSPTAFFLMGPALAVNLLTTYSPMHLIETYHYSAHLVPFVILGGIYGMGTVTRFAERWKIARGVTRGALCSLVLAATLIYHHYRGYTPLSGEFVGYQLTAHDRLGNQLASELTQTLPIDAPLSAQGNQYPHLSHRPSIWMFPEVDTAQTIFLDVSTLPNTIGLNEGIHDKVREVIGAGGFNPVIAIDGYLVLRQGVPSRPLPDEFYSFARADASAIEHPLNVQFGDDLDLLGFDVVPDRDGKVNLRAYWRARRPIQADLFLPFFITDGEGHEVGAAVHRQPANVWYPTNQWRPGEIVRITTYNLPIGRRGQDFGIALGAQTSGDPWNTDGRLRPIVREAPAPLRTPGQGALVEVVTFHNDRDILTPIQLPLVAGTRPDHPMDVRFDEGIGLAGYTVTADPGKGLGVTLYWNASGATRAPYTVFAHVLDRDGKLIAQRDAPPAEGAKATTAWIKGETVVDRREISLPPGLTLAGAKVEIGLYDPVTGQRLIAHVGGKDVDHVDVGL